MDPTAVTAWHKQQLQHATTRPTFRPEIPQDHRCPAGACSSPPPPPPAGTETFVAPPPAGTLPFAWHATMAAAFLLFVVVTRR
jgi:hypothetical protein